MYIYIYIYIYIYVYVYICMYYNVYNNVYALYRDKEIDKDKEIITSEFTETTETFEHNIYINHIYKLYTYIYIYIYMYSL